MPQATTLSLRNKLGYGLGDLGQNIIFSGCDHLSAQLLHGLFIIGCRLCRHIIPAGTHLGWDE